MMVGRSADGSIFRRGSVPIMLFLIAQTIAAVVWATTLQEQVKDLRNRIPKLEQYSMRQILIEERQRVVIETLRDNALKLNTISKELREHLEKTRQ